MNEIDRWLDAGAEVETGLRLLSIYSPNKALELLIRKAPAKYSYLLIEKLSAHRSGNKSGAKSNFRSVWKFLSEPDCPAELKILASDKITAYSNVIDLHSKLFGCTTQEEAYKVSEELVNNFVENEKIFSEFTFYQQHHKILGHHPLFESRRRIASLKHLSILSLLEKQRRLKNNIWRAKDEIKKNLKPELRPKREERINILTTELNEVNRLIEDYERSNQI